MYLMESPEEARRLLAQEQASSPAGLLRLTGLQPGACVLDAGCGPGGISEVISELIGEQGRLTLLDLSAERLQEAARRLAGRPNLRLLEADVRCTGLEGESFDYVFCQFVLQYLPDRHRAVDELVRLVRPGGRVVLSEIDGFGLYNWPMSEPVEQGCRRFASALERQGFDLHVGRKLFAQLRRAGLQELRVHVLPLYTVPGAADVRLLTDWQVRFRTLEPVVASAFGGSEGYWAWCDSYLDMMRDEGSLKYAVQLVTEGSKP